MGDLEIIRLPIRKPVSLFDVGMAACHCPILRASLKAWQQDETVSLEQALMEAAFLLAGERQRLLELIEEASRRVSTISGVLEIRRICPECARNHANAL